MADSRRHTDLPPLRMLSKDGSTNSPSPLLPIQAARPKQPHKPATAPPHRIPVFHRCPLCAPNVIAFCWSPMPTSPASYSSAPSANTQLASTSPIQNLKATNILYVLPQTSSPPYTTEAASPQTTRRRIAHQGKQKPSTSDGLHA